MNAPFLTLAWSFGAILALQAPLQAQGADSLPVSLERIRAGLAQPPSLWQVPRPPSDTPTFRIEIREQLVLPQPVEETPYDLTMGLPSAGELLMDGIIKIQSAVVHYKRRRAERHARKEVDDAVAAFCAARDCTVADGR